MPEDTGINITRREFLAGSTGVCFSFVLPAAWTKNDGTGELTAWVRIDPDSTVTIMSPAAELGQGSMTAIPMIFAEELDADWDKVRIEFSPADDTYFNNPTAWIHGIMLTLGSSAVSGYFDSARLYGAQARKILLQTAATYWKVPVREVSTEPGMVIHSRCARRLTFGEVAQRVVRPVAIPVVDKTDLKPADRFRIIGSDVPRYDIPEKVNGSARYSIDIHLPGMVYAFVVHSPVRGATPVAVKNRDEILGRSNVSDVILLAGAVAVVATTIEAAYMAEKVLDIEWSSGTRLDDYSSERGLQSHLDAVKDTGTDGFPVQQQGDARMALNRANRVYATEYLCDYVYHAHLEPLNAVASVSADGRNAEVWAGTQAPSHCVRSVAKELGTDGKNIMLHRTYLGGAFGRRGAQDHDYVIDAVQLSKMLQKPVKAIWSREADVHTGRLKPLMALYLRAGEDETGRLVAWSHRTAGDEALKQSDPYRYGKNGGWPVISSDGMSTDYAIENVSAELFDLDTGMRAAPMRGIGGSFNRFAGESFLDEIALQKKLDPLAFRLQLLHKHAAARRVLEAVARMSGWKKRGEHAGLGMAFDSVYYPTAYVMQVKVDKTTGVIQVPRVWVALDVGLAVHPRNIRGQLESQIIFGISNALKEQITVRSGMIEQNNFHDYPVMRLNEIPEIEIEIQEGNRTRPLGVGDSRVAIIPAAIANGFASLTGRRLRHLPFLPSRVKAVLS